jgi:tRNA (guanine-N7-)-methyltransferase
MSGRRDSLWGRRKGKPLSARRTDLMATRFQALALDLADPPPADLAALFPVPVSSFRIEIGFGGGEHLIAEALADPAIGYFGVEPFLNGMAKAVAAIADGNIGNVRLFGGDAALLLDWLPAASLQRADLLYPDPWPKKRHRKRRFVSQENLDRISRVLVEGGILRVATDIADYADWTLLQVNRRADFAWTAELADDWRQPYPGWHATRYEAKAVKAGRKPTYLAFRKLSAT